MKTMIKVAGAIAAILAIISVASCSLAAGPSKELISAAKELKSIIPGIQAGMSLVKPDDPAERAFDPSGSAPTDWDHGTESPATVYGSGTTTKRFPSTGGYYHMANGDQIYLTLTPEFSLGGNPYYRLVLYTYPAFDLSVAYTIEEYIVDSSGVAAWPWGNLNLSLQPNSWISLTTAYLDGTFGTRTVVWNSNQTTNQFYAAFAVPDPDPATTASFVDYRQEQSATPPVKIVGPMRYSSHTTERVLGKKTVTESTQYYTETDDYRHSGLTYVFQDKKHKWAEDTYITTRMEEDTSLGVKKIRSVGEVGTDQYYIDKVDIALSGGKISYKSTHDVYDKALPRGGDRKAKDYVALDVLEDSAGAGTFTGTMQETQGDTEVVRDVKIDRDSFYRFQVSMKYKSSGVRPKALTDDITIPLTRQNLSNLSIPLAGANATFNGYYEAGTLYGTLTSGSLTYDVVVADEGVAIDDTLYAY